MSVCQCDSKFRPFCILLTCNIPLFCSNKHTHTQSLANARVLCSFVEKKPTTTFFAYIYQMKADVAPSVRSHGQVFFCFWMNCCVRFFPKMKFRVGHQVKDSFRSLFTDGCARAWHTSHPETWCQTDVRMKYIIMRYANAFYNCFVRQQFNCKFGCVIFIIIILVVSIVVIVVKPLESHSIFDLYSNCVYVDVVLFNAWVIRHLRLWYFP